MDTCIPDVTVKLIKESNIIDSVIVSDASVETPQFNPKVTENLVGEFICSVMVNFNGTGSSFQQPFNITGERCTYYGPPIPVTFSLPSSPPTHTSHSLPTILTTHPYQLLPTTITTHPYQSLPFYHTHTHPPYHPHCPPKLNTHFHLLLPSPTHIEHPPTSGHYPSSFSTLGMPRPAPTSPGGGASMLHATITLLPTMVIIFLSALL